MSQDFERSDWVATPAAQAVIRDNQPLLAYLAGESERFTSKAHNFHPGETVEKQLIVINNSRQTVTADCKWSLNLPRPDAGSAKLTIATGEQQRTRLRFNLPAALAAGQYELRATVRFSNGETQKDSFSLNIL